MVNLTLNKVCWCLSCNQECQYYVSWVGQPVAHLHHHHDQVDALPPPRIQRLGTEHVSEPTAAAGVWSAETHSGKKNSKNEK